MIEYFVLCGNRSFPAAKVKPPQDTSSPVECGHRSTGGPCRGGLSSEARTRGRTSNGGHFAECRLSLRERNATFSQQKATLSQHLCQSECHWANVRSKATCCRPGNRDLVAGCSKLQSPFRQIRQNGPAKYRGFCSRCTRNYAASRNFREGFSMVTIVFGGTLRLSVTLDPTNVPAPTIVVPPSMDALL